MAKCMKFGSSVVMEYQTVGAEILETAIPFNERELYETFASIIKKECNVEEIDVKITRFYINIDIFVIIILNFFNSTLKLMMKD